MSANWTLVLVFFMGILTAILVMYIMKKILFPPSPTVSHEILFWKELEKRQNQQEQQLKEKQLKEQQLKEQLKDLSLSLNIHNLHVNPPKEKKQEHPLIIENEREKEKNE